MAQSKGRQQLRKIFLAVDESFPITPCELELLYNIWTKIAAFGCEKLVNSVATEVNFFLNKLDKLYKKIKKYLCFAVLK